MVALLVAVAVVSYVVSDKVGEGSRGTVERLGRYIPLQSVKIVVVSWQILTQVRVGVVDEGWFEGKLEEDL